METTLPMGASRGRTTDRTNRPSVTQGWAHTQALCQSRPISRPSPTLPTGSSSDHNYLLFGTSSVSCTKAVSRPLEVSFTAWEWTDLNSGLLLWLSGKKPTWNAGDTFRVQSLGWEDPLEEEMATCSSIIAWRIPWAEEPGRLARSRT